MDSNQDPTPLLGSTSPESVLVFDPSLLRRFLAGKAVRAAGATVTCTSDLRGALRELVARPVHVAMLDIDEGGASARELVAVIRSEMPSTYVVAVSSHDSDANLEACFAEGFQDFVRKPVREAGVQAVLAAASAARLESAAGLARADTGDLDISTEELRSQLMAHLGDETQRLLAMLSGAGFSRVNLRRWMHRVRSGLLLVGYRQLADECLDLERDCDLPHVDDNTLKRRGWRVVGQMRILRSSDSGSASPRPA